MGSQQCSQSADDRAMGTGDLVLDVRMYMRSLVPRLISSYRRTRKSLGSRLVCAWVCGCGTSITAVPPDSYR